MEARVRLGSMICLGLSLAAAPAQAQFAAPFGGGGVLTAPEAASGAFGAGAAHSLQQQQQQCTSMATGRDGPRGVCAPSAQPSQPARR